MKTVRPKMCKKKKREKGFIRCTFVLEGIQSNVRPCPRQNQYLILELRHNSAHSENMASSSIAKYIRISNIDHFH